MTPTPKRRIIPDIEAFEERIAIAEYDGGLPRPQAENLTAQEQGFATADAYWQWLADCVIHRPIG